MMQLHFRVQGQGPPLIILHGLFGSLENWAFISQQLADEFQIFSLDQRNHGQSPHDPEMNYSALAGDIAEFMDQQNLAAAFLLGHSMGGKAAMEFSLLHPERVDRLIVVDMTPRAYEPRHEDIFQALLALELGNYRIRAEVEEALSQKIPDLAVRRFLLKSLARDAEGRLHWKFNLPALHQNYAALTGALETDGSFARPTLFIRGGQSDYIAEQDEPAIRNMFPQARILTIPEASHWVHAERATEFLTAVREFLSVRL